MSQQNKRQQDFYVRANKNPEGMRKTEAEEEKNDKERQRGRINTDRHPSS